eukprot:TRINITY_DN42748_c0_g2_i1.p4 TRINITY_DN42748_c0_g2~~TRINITY_DN42748_c0_g2_i1.p4  ORF type:complete len:102 (+),score=6.21 TRINITY_DN42748_c0_g2_i1:342-647(+)
MSLGRLALVEAGPNTPEEVPAAASPGRIDTAVPAAYCQKRHRLASVDRWLQMAQPPPSCTRRCCPPALPPPLTMKDATKTVQACPHRSVCVESISAASFDR